MLAEWVCILRTSYLMAFLLVPPLWRKAGRFKMEQRPHTTHHHRRHRKPVDLYHYLYKMRKEYIACIKILKRAFNINVAAHKYSEKSQEAYRRWDYDLAGFFSDRKSDCYRHKSERIADAIRIIKKYKLPIKWGLNDWIFYFCIHWRQISFHTFGRNTYKRYNGKWSCRENGNKFPLNMEVPYLQKNLSQGEA